MDKSLDRMDLISISEASVILGYRKDSGKEKLLQLVEDNYIEKIEVENGGKVYIKRDSLNSFLETIKKEYITAEKVSELYKIKLRTIKEKSELNKIVIQGKHYFKLEEIKELYDFEDYINLIEVVATSNLSKGTIYQLIKEDVIFKKIKKNGPHYFIHRGCVNTLLSDIKYLRENYYTSFETRNILYRKSTNDFTKYFAYIKRPLIANAFDQSQSGSNFLYLKKDVDNFYKEKIEKQQGPRPIDSYEYFLFLIDGIDCFTNRKETFESVKQYTKIVISNSNGNNKSLDAIAKNFAKLIEYIHSFKIKKNIHLYNEKEIFSLMKYINTQPTREIFYNYLRFLSERKLCKFEIKKIKNPRYLRIKSQEKEVYNFEEFVFLYESASNINMHLEYALKSERYASLWLYILIHLTNAWRHSDVIRIPQVDPEISGINDIDWFKINKLNLPSAQKIINQVHSFELEISKTGMKRHFFCGNNLVIPVATSMIICEFHRRKTNFPSLINFGTSYNEPSESMFREFFEKDEKTNNMKFSSLKMNRSLMEHLFYSIQRSNGKGNSAFELVQKMRNHSTEITKEYIRAVNDEKDFDNITRQLFVRGEFGYIYDELIDVITTDKENSIEKRTLEIEKARMFLNPIEVETTMGFLNKRLNEKDSVINEIKKLNPDEAFNFIRKLYLKEMPSKMENIQCFAHPNCERKLAEKSCLSCPFAIPNVYALNSLKEEIFSAIGEYNSSKTKGTKKKMTQSLNYLLDLLSQALKEFGEEFVWSFIEGGEKMLEDELKKIN